MAASELKSQGFSIARPVNVRRKGEKFMERPIINPAL